MKNQLIIKKTFQTNTNLKSYLQPWWTANQYLTQSHSQNT